MALQEKKLLILQSMVEALREFIPYIKDPQLVPPNDLRKRVINTAENFCNILEVRAPEKARVIKKFIDALNWKPTNPRMCKFPALDGLCILDIEWNQKDPRDFQELIKIRKNLTK